MDFQEINFDPHSMIKEDLLQSPFVRYYIQEQYFICNTSVPKLQVKLPFNLIANEALCDLNNMNRMVANNSRLTNSFLENGRDILKKKEDYFNEFLKIYPIINHALTNMAQDKRLVFIYSMMALSNLILKLSINMAKISIVTVSRQLNPNYLNIFMVSILFQKFLEYSLLKAKQSFPIQKKDKEHLIKQFPKVSIIKLSKIRNCYDIKYLHKCQQLFDQQAKNIQFIELYEYDLGKDEQQSTYARYQSINLMDKFGLRQPFGFELYLFISDVIINKMIDFKPDIIIYMEDYDSDCVVIDPRIRGLIINEFSSKVQNKIYIFKQIGITEQMKNTMIIKQNQVPIPEMVANEEIKKTLIKIISSKTQNLTLSQQQIELYKVIKSQIKNYLDQSNYIQNCINKQLIDLKEQDYKFQKNQILIQGKKREVSAFGLKIKEIQKIHLDQFVHVSTAMIQKSNFEGILQQYRNYKFSPVFLKKFIQWLQSEHLKGEKKEKGFTQNGEFLRKKIEKVTGMLNLRTFVSRQLLTQTSKIKGFPFYNLKTNSIEYLSEIKGYEYTPIHISPEDSFYVAYLTQFIVVFVFRSQSYSVYARHLTQSHFTCEKQECCAKNHLLLCKNSILVANDKYLYKAFGQFQNQQDNKESLIHRLCIQKPRQIRFQSWQTMNKECMVFAKVNNVNKGIKIPLEFKRYGFGYSYTADETGKAIDIIILGGGYNFKAQNEQRVNRYFYIIKNNGPQIVKVGKTNGDIVNQTENLRNKNIIYPFVYGIPLEYERGKQLAIINTNGYEQGLNHFKRLFLTRVQINSFMSPTSVGIIAQNKLEYDKSEIQTAIAHKNSIVSLLIKNYSKINRLGDRVVFYEEKENVIVFKLQKHGENGCDVFKLDSATVEEENRIQSQFSNKTLFPSSQPPLFSIKK